jgi:hypothetical protein
VRRADDVYIHIQSGNQVEMFYFYDVFEEIRENQHDEFLEP